MKLYKDKLFNFIEIFNEKNGLLIRTNILDKDGFETAEEPFMRSFPELIDIGIMGKCHVNQLHCKNFGVDCYQANNCYKDMTLEDYKLIINQCKGKTFQVALGGRGDPNKHEKFGEILKYTFENGIIPNLTTTGIGLTEYEIKCMREYCGAVAISLYSKIIVNNGKYEESNYESIKAIKRLVENKITTNIHYVISTETLDDIILRLKKGLFPKGINAIIFLLYKPVGLGTFNKVINVNDDKFKELIQIINENKYKYKFGFDTCFSPMIFKYLDNIDEKTIEFCEAARFSCYISPNMFMYPCSFVQIQKYGINLKSYTLEEAWFSIENKKFKKLGNNFKGCCPAHLNNYSNKKEI